MVRGGSSLSNLGSRQSEQHSGTDKGDGRQGQPTTWQLGLESERNAGLEKPWHTWKRRAGTLVGTRTVESAWLAQRSPLGRRTKALPYEVYSCTVSDLALVHAPAPSFHPPPTDQRTDDNWTSLPVDTDGSPTGRIAAWLASLVDTTIHQPMSAWCT